MNLIKKGLITFAIGIIVNVSFTYIGIGGLLRELSRLTVLAGIVIIIIGLIKKIFKK